VDAAPPDCNLPRYQVEFPNFGDEEALAGGEALCRTRNAGNPQAADHEIRVT